MNATLIDVMNRTQRYRAGDYRLLQVSLALTVCLHVGACTPKVEVVPPEEPITINLNVKIDHEIRVKVEKELDDVLSEDGDLF